MGPARSQWLQQESGESRHARIKSSVLARSKSSSVESLLPPAEVCSICSMLNSTSLALSLQSCGLGHASPVQIVLLRSEQCLYARTPGSEGFFLTDRRNIVLRIQVRITVPVCHHLPSALFPAGTCLYSVTGQQFGHSTVDLSQRILRYPEPGNLKFALHLRSKRDASRVADLLGSILDPGPSSSRASSEDV